MSTPLIEILDPEYGEQYRPSWFWFIAFGIALLALGALAFGLLKMASIISTFSIGIIMFTGGALGIVHALGLRYPDRHHLWISSGLFYSAAGVAILVEPVVGLRALTLMLAVSLAMSGISRLVIGAQLRSNAVLISGTASILAATVIGIDWPEDSLWIIGPAIAMDLIVQGISSIVTGMTLRLAAGTAA